MNSMGQGPQNKLQAMMMGMLGNPDQAPATAGPSPGQPRGMSQPHDPAMAGFQSVKKGLDALSQMLLQLGDQVSSNSVAQLGIDLAKIGETRSDDLLKKLELDQKYGQAEQMINSSGAAARPQM